MMWKGAASFNAPSASFQGGLHLVRWPGSRVQARASTTIATHTLRTLSKRGGSEVLVVESHSMDKYLRNRCLVSHGLYRYFNSNSSFEGIIHSSRSSRRLIFGNSKGFMTLRELDTEYEQERKYIGNKLCHPEHEYISAFPELSNNNENGIFRCFGAFKNGNILVGCQRVHAEESIHARLHYGGYGAQQAHGVGYNGYMHYNKRHFGSLSGSGKDGHKREGPLSKVSDMVGTSRSRSASTGILSLSVDILRWVVVLPFRIGMWTLQLFSLTIKMVGHLMRMSARAAVVAKASGVSGIFKSIVDGLKHTVHWCKTGFRLYFANVKVSYYILLKRLKGHPMRYNERKLLMKTLNDALKLVPFSFFIIVPFAEFLLPVAIRLFPQMLPSTFRTDNPKSDDYLQKKLLAKKELAQFFQELVQERTNQIVQEELDSSLKTKMAALKDFQERLRNKGDTDINPFLSSNELLVFSKLFKKEFKLDQMNLETLKVMCKLLGISPFSMRSHVVLQLRHHLLKIQREDRLILWEGVDSLTTEELQEACRDRAMKFFNVTREQLQQQLQQWLDLSSMPEISPILLLWSRCFTMTHEPMVIKADDEIKLETGVEESKGLDEKSVTSNEHDTEFGKHSKIAEKFAEEVTTVQKASSRKIVQAVAAAAEVDAQKLLNKEERLEELSQKAKELKDIIEGNIQQPEEALHVDGTQTIYDPKSEEFLDMHSVEERFMQLNQGDHVILHPNEINKLSQLGKQEILMKCEELLSALDLQRRISDIQHTQLSEILTYLLKVSEDLESGKEFNFKDDVGILIKAARKQMENIEELTHQFDKHNLTYD